MSKNQHNCSSTINSGHKHYPYPNKDGHSHSNSSQKSLLLALICTLTYAAIEGVCGYFSNSLALSSEAGHMFSDSISLALASLAAYLAKKPPSKSHSFGLGRIEIIAAWISSVLLILVAIKIIIHAIENFHNVSTINTTIVIYTSIGSIILNSMIVWLFHHSEPTLNLRAALLHIIGDLLTGFSTLIVGIIIYFTKWNMIDPILSIFIASLIIISSLHLIKETIHILLEGVPQHISLDQVGMSLAKIPRVMAVHDLHIWTLSSGFIMLSAHIELEDYLYWDQILKSAQQILLEEFNISHTTIQPEKNKETHPLNFVNSRIAKDD